MRSWIIGATSGGNISIGLDTNGTRNSADVTIDGLSSLSASSNSGSGGDISIAATDTVTTGGTLSAQGTSGGNITISFGTQYNDIPLAHY